MKATITVVKLPINAYQGHAVEVPKSIKVINAILAIMPIRAWISRAFLMKAPTRNTPRIGPFISDATDNAMPSAELFASFNAIAIAI